MNLDFFTIYDDSLYIQCGCIGAMPINANLYCNLYNIVIIIRDGNRARWV